MSLGESGVGGWQGLGGGVCCYTGERISCARAHALTLTHTHAMAAGSCWDGTESQGARRPGHPVPSVLDGGIGKRHWISR